VDRECPSLFREKSYCKLATLIVRSHAIQLIPHSQKDFSALLAERNVITNLNALEELLADASRRRARAVEGSTPPTPPHLLAPSQILEAHLAPQLASQQSQLNAKLQTTQSQNAALFRTIQGQKAEIETLLDGLENTVRDLEDANAKLGGEVPGLRSVVRDVEAEMADI
jgi:kinetochore protein NNF1